MRILGIDPGMTRCGVGVIDVDSARRLTLVSVHVITTPSGDPLAQRLMTLNEGIRAALEQFQPERFALERVFSQLNVRTVMSVAQVSGLAIVAAAERGIPVDLHTPSEVKAAVTGTGRATKQQVAGMVARLLGIDTAGMLPDATDALALAITNAWRGGAGGLISEGEEEGLTSLQSSLTPAQQKWREAERLSRRRG